MSSLIVRGERPDLLVGAEGQPMPPAQALVDLAAIDPALGMQFFPVAQDQSGCWCITESWRENDPRWASVICGDVPREKTYDIIGWAPRDMKSEDALSYLLAALNKAPESVREAQGYVSKIQSHTATMRKQMITDHVCEAAGIGEAVAAGVL